MRAVGLDFEHRTVTERDVAEPAAPAAGEALLRIHEIGVCATDRELARFRFGAPPEGQSFLTIGHEVLAEVLECAGGMSRGDWVVPMIRRSCAARCEACRSGRRDLCRTGQYLERGIQGAHGYFAPLAVDPIEELMPVPQGLLEVAALAEPLSVVEKAVDTAFRAHPLGPASAVVAGAGPIGLLAAMLLEMRGLAVTVVSLEPEASPRAALVRKAGARYLSKSRPDDADIVIECSGSADEVLEWLAPNGVLVLVGAPEREMEVAPVRMMASNMTVTGVVNASRAHFEASLRDLARMPRNWLESLIERRAFERWPESLRGQTEPAKILHRMA